MAFGDSSKKGWSTVKDGTGTSLVTYRDQIKTTNISKPPVQILKKEKKKKEVKPKIQSDDSPYDESEDESKYKRPKSKRLEAKINVPKRKSQKAIKLEYLKELKEEMLKKLSQVETERLKLVDALHSSIPKRD